MAQVEGCDGFKTGYYTAAGYSIAATATRNGARVIAVVLGSRERTVRDAKAAELLSKAFLAAPRPAAPATPAAPAAAAAPTVSTNGFLRGCRLNRVLEPAAGRMTANFDMVADDRTSRDGRASRPSRGIPPRGIPPGPLLQPSRFRCCRTG